MARPASKHPTQLELEILQALWKLGPSSVQQIRQALAPTRELAYTTVITMLTIMSGKKLVRKQRSGARHVFAAAVKQSDATGGMLQDLIQRVYGGSKLAVMQQLLDTNEIDADELAAIRRLINRKAKEQS